jgi:Ca-activated chloride channel family protein
LPVRSPEARAARTAFSSGYYEFASEPLTATAENLSAARRFVQRLEAGGGTEMLPALLHLMRKPEIPGYLRHIVLLTDGDLGNEEQIFSALRQCLGGARLYTVAIGSAPNFFLATKMAQFGRGTFTHIADISEIRELMGRLLESLENPVLTDVKLSFEGVEVADLYPERPPDLFLRQPLLIFGRISQGHKGTLRITPAPAAILMKPPLRSTLRKLLSIPASPVSGPASASRNSWTIGAAPMRTPGPKFAQL